MRSIYRISNVAMALKQRDPANKPHGCNVSCSYNN